MSRRYRSNAPSWVNEALFFALPSLGEVVKKAWLPRPSERSAEFPRGDVKELGCGQNGCVLPTADPKVVCKVTPSAREALFIGQVMALGKAPEAMVKFHKIVAYQEPDALGPDHVIGNRLTASRRMFFAFREAADPVATRALCGTDAKWLRAVGDQLYEVAQCLEQLAHARADQVNDDTRDCQCAWGELRWATGRARKASPLLAGPMDAIEHYAHKGLYLTDVNAGNLMVVPRLGPSALCIIDTAARVAPPLRPVIKCDVVGHGASVFQPGDDEEPGPEGWEPASKSKSWF